MLLKDDVSCAHSQSQQRAKITIIFGYLPSFTNPAGHYLDVHAEEYFGWHINEEFPLLTAGLYGSFQFPAFLPDL